MSESRKYTEAQKQSAKKWDAANLDRISIALPKGRKDDIRAAAVAAGESMNQYIINAVDQRMERDASGGPQKPVEGGVVSLPSETDKTAPAASEEA